MKYDGETQKTHCSGSVPGKWDALNHWERSSVKLCKHSNVLLKYETEVRKYKEKVAGLTLQKWKKYS